jgi:acyl-homoserine lactone acylase PvdQ
MSRVSLCALAAACALLLAPAGASADDFAGTALNIIPSGQYGGLPVPAGADEQAQMYDSLTPLFDQVTAPDLLTAFKSEKFGVDNAGPGRPEAVPRAGVTIVRDRFNVPHITGKTRDDVTWAMGWVLEEDRALLLAQGRYPARLAAVDAPNIDAFGLVTGLKSYTPAPAVDRMILRNSLRALRSAPNGKALLHDVDVYVEGLNARLKAEKSTAKPFTRVDVFAVNALVGQIFGQGGGGEAPRSQLLSGLRKRLGAKRAQSLFDDLTENADADSPATLTKRTPYEAIPKKAPGSVALDAGSYKPQTFGKASAAAAATGAGATQHRWASNFLIVGKQKSVDGHPLFVGGPQIGYFYPGLTLEADVSGPGFQARGATAPGFPGNILIGRGPDFVWSLTSAGSDLIDHYVETLCGARARATATRAAAGRWTRSTRG